MKKYKNNKPKKGLARLMELAGKKKALIIGAVFLSVLASVVSFVPYIAIYYIMREIIGVYPDLANLDTPKIVKFGWIALGGAAGNFLIYFAALMCSHLAAFGTVHRLQLDFASHLAKLPLGFHLHFGSGKLRKMMDENIPKIELFIAHQLPDLAAAAAAPVVMLGVLFAFDWRFGAMALVGIVLAFIVQLQAFKVSGKDAMAKYEQALEEMNNASMEYIRGISVVKAFQQTVYSFRQLYEAIKAYTKFVIPFTLMWEKYFPAFLTILHNIYLLLIPVGIWIGFHTDDYAAYALTFIFYLLFVPSITSVLTKIFYVSQQMKQVSGRVERVDSILNKAPLPQTDRPQTGEGYDIEFKNVSFSYGNGNDENALSNVSFMAKQGEVTAIVGPSGSGKSTIAHLIPRFYDVTEGSIAIGGVDIREMKFDDLMEKVSFVFQDVFLFKQSITDNIRTGRQNATNEEVIAAAKAAQCQEFIERLPNRYSTVIGAKGVHLSGGERQRLAIARAIAKDSPLIVLDEATAFADPENEYLIQKAFEKLMQNKTVIIIAHRLSTVRGAGKIIVMDKGRVAEQGTHEELMKRNGKYSAMWEMYTKAIDWKIKRGAEGICLT